MRRQVTLLLVASLVASLAAGCSATTPQAKAKSSTSASPTHALATLPPPHSDWTISVTARQPTAHVTSWERVTAAKAASLPHSKTAVIFICVGPDLLSVAMKQRRVREAVWNGNHELLASNIVTTPIARMIRIPPGPYFAQVASIDQRTGKPNAARAETASGRLRAGESIYLVQGNGCPSPKAKLPQ